MYRDLNGCDSKECASMGTTIPIRIVGQQAPGATCSGPDSIFLGVQKGKEVVDAVPSSTSEPAFELEIEVEDNEPDSDFCGPYVHGPKGDRFLYLAWTDGIGGPLVARIKLRLLDIEPDLRAAARNGGTLTGTLSLIDAQGRPRSGSIRPPEIAWSLANADTN
jgi:hypothetical protein